jgi:hypothetical protein
MLLKAQYQLSQRIRLLFCSENAREGGKAFNRRFSALVNVLRYVFFQRVSLLVYAMLFLFQASESLMEKSRQKTEHREL